MSLPNIDASGQSFPDAPVKPPKGFTPPEPPQAPGANCSAWDDDCAQFGYPGGHGAFGVPRGHGGNGGSIFVQAGIDNSTNSDPLDARGGLGGQPGTGGQAGAPGLPGEQGATPGVFSASSDCPFPGIPIWGNPGLPGPSGQGGASGNAGSVRLVVTG